MRRTFNLGLGLVAVEAAQGADSVLRLPRHGPGRDIVGEVVPSDAVDDDRVTFLDRLSPVRVAVLVSGGGTNLQALLDAEADGRPRGCAEIVG
jgi:hypothetical protein